MKACSTWSANCGPSMVMTTRRARVAHVDTEYAPYEDVGEKEVSIGAV